LGLSGSSDNALLSALGLSTDSTQSATASTTSATDAVLAGLSSTNTDTSYNSAQAATSATQIASELKANPGLGAVLVQNSVNEGLVSLLQ